MTMATGTAYGELRGCYKCFSVDCMGSTPVLPYECGLTVLAGFVQQTSIHPAFMSAQKIHAGNMTVRRDSDSPF